MNESGMLKIDESTIAQNLTEKYIRIDKNTLLHNRNDADFGLFIIIIKLNIRQIGLINIERQSGKKASTAGGANSIGPNKPEDDEYALA